MAQHTTGHTRKIFWRYIGILRSNASFYRSSNVLRESSNVLGGCGKGIFVSRSLYGLFGWNFDGWISFFSSMENPESFFSSVCTFGLDF